MNGQPRTPEPHESEPDDYVPQSRLEYLATVNPRKKKRLWPRLLSGFVVAVLAAVGGWYVYQHRTPSAHPSTVQAPAKAAPKPADENAVIATEHHDSSNFNLGFDYPEKWIVTDKGDGKITVVSPAVTRKNLTGQSEIVQTVVTIAPKGQNVAAFDKGSGLAVRASEKIKYTNPTSVQRAETYLTFVQFSTTPAGEGLDALYVTGDNGYQKGQYIPKTDMVNLDPVIAVTFQKCADTKCTQAAPSATTLPASAWSDSAFRKPILVVLTSLSVN